MFKHQPGYIPIMNTGHEINEINLTAILDLHVLALSVTGINVRSDRPGA